MHKISWKLEDEWLEPIKEGKEVGWKAGILMQLSFVMSNIVTDKIRIINRDERGNTDEEAAKDWERTRALLKFQIAHHERELEYILQLIGNDHAEIVSRMKAGYKHALREIEKYK